MEPLTNLLYLLEPASLALICTAVLVVLASAHRALTHEKEAERHKDLSDSAITLDGRQALMVPFASSISLLLMFYLFASVSQLVTAFTAIAAASSVTFAFAPAAAALVTSVGLLDPVVTRCTCGNFSRSQLALAAVSAAVVLMWLVSGHWILNNFLGISICIAFVSHVRLPNVKICALLLACLFVYDIFWVYFSEQFFGANVMVTVATQQAQNPVHTVAHRLHLPVSHTIAKKLDLPVKLLFPRNLLDVLSGSSSAVDFMMLGLGDMAIPGMLMALVHSFEQHKGREQEQLQGQAGFGSGAAGAGGWRGYKYVWYATAGYAVGLIAALAAGVLTRAPQPALLYLVPSTLGPVAAVAWSKREVGDLWHGITRKAGQSEKDKARLDSSC